MFGIIDSFMQKGTFYHFWFLGSLMIIYSILPILNKKIYYDKRKFKKMLIMLGLICIVVDILNILFGLINGKIITIKVIQTFRLWTWLFYFSLGGYIAKYSSKNESKYEWKDTIFLITNMIIVIAYQTIIGKYVFKEFHAEYFYDNIFIMIYVYIIFTSIKKIQIEEKYVKYIEQINQNTMGIYILHILIIRILRKFILGYSFIDNCLIYVITIFVSTIISTMIGKIPKVNKIIKL